MRQKMARFLNRAGTIIIVVMILFCIPFTLPRLFGLHIYEVESESMEPEYPVGSVVYVKEVETSDIIVGDVITYTLGTDTDFVMTHRVVEVLNQGRSFVTKGDANPVEDAEPVSSERVIGCPVVCIRGIAPAADFINTSEGKAVVAGMFVFVFLMWMLAERMQKKELNIQK